MFPVTNVSLDDRGVSLVSYLVWFLLDITMQAVEINNKSSLKVRRDQGHSLKRYYKLAMSKDGTHALQVNEFVHSLFFS